MDGGDVGDASALPYESAAFDLVTLNNMIPFFDELARVTAPGGYVAYRAAARIAWATSETVPSPKQTPGPALPTLPAPITPTFIASSPW